MPGEAYVGDEEDFLSCRNGEAWEQAAQGCGAVPILGGIKRMSACGTWGHGQITMKVLGRRLGLISEGFTSLHDSGSLTCSTSSSLRCFVSAGAVLCQSSRSVKGKLRLISFLCTSGKVVKETRFGLGF